MARSETVFNLQKGTNDGSETISTRWFHKQCSFHIKSIKRASESFLQLHDKTKGGMKTISYFHNCIYSVQKKFQSLQTCSLGGSM